MKFSEKQVLLVRESWGELKKLGMQEVGLKIFQRLFNDAPFLRSMFYKMDIPEEQQLSVDQLRENPTMKTHATRVATSISKLVKNMEEEEVMNAKLKELGELHALHNVEPEYFEYLAPVMLAVIGETLEIKSNDPIIQAWIKFYGVIRTGIINAM